jgi:hypothetical protein
MVTICHKYYHDSVFQKKTENKINTAKFSKSKLEKMSA